MHKPIKAIGINLCEEKIVHKQLISNLFNIINIISTKQDLKWLTPEQNLTSTGLLSPKWESSEKDFISWTGLQVLKRI